VRQVCVIERTRRIGDKEEKETVFGITSLSAQRAPAAVLLRVSRAHWGIENRIHYIRDVSLGEDFCRVRSGGAPGVLAGLRNAALRLLREAGVGNVAEALRRHAAKPEEAVKLATELVPRTFE